MTGAIRIEHRMVGDRHVYTSPDLKGLYVAHRSRETAQADIVPSIVALSRALGTPVTAEIDVVHVEYA